MTQHQHINASGFPLQLAVAKAVQDELGEWKILYQEHAWRSTDSAGFIDLAIEWTYSTWVMNIECKRVKDTEWIFLRDSAATKSRKHAKLWITNFSSKGNCSHFNWTEVAMDPHSVESNMCVVPGQDSKATPMLERIANSVVISTEALASAEAKLLSNSYSGIRMYQNVIVTTAKLCVCDVDLKKISLSTGEIDPGSPVTEVPYVRFRKQVGAKASKNREEMEIYALQAYSESQESTVFIVNADHFVDFVKRCSVDDTSLLKVGGIR